MSAEKPLDLHSEQSTQLNIDSKAEELSINGQAPISVDGAKRFFLTSSLTFLLVHLSIPLAVGVHIFDSEYFHDLFTNYAGIGNGYDIASGVLVIVCLIGLSIPALARSPAKFIFWLILEISYLYLAFFLLMYSTKVLTANYDWLLTFYTIFFSGALGLFFAALFGSRKPNAAVGIIISLMVSISAYICFAFVLKWFNPYLWVWGIMIACGPIYACLLCTDAALMLDKRGESYIKTDWALGCGHFFTDIFFLFWWSLITKPKKTLAVEEFNIPHDQEQVIDL